MYMLMLCASVILGNPENLKVANALFEALNTTPVN
jgi:hypothetical protein